MCGSSRCPPTDLGSRWLGLMAPFHLFQRRPGDRLQRVVEPLKVSAGLLMDVSFSPRGRRLASFPGEEVRGGGFMKAAFTADGGQVLLATT
jgi:hypothetical protein